ncbi:hypothetical protein EXU85_07825 [Spirosoma sp. KCTC 42546]|uniref:hypothetical protein n=1 Tax=Spirosoma sp. KCTC 42546 TaxID=2520506 RepID=UPI0011589E0A|nr:hypothetical protein [Spirosoma sp. KCTC 42546]QDK78522.1 hypothetical protein EXU85_07825 [Spirosoma sp. KCTC 42546]
MIKIINMTALEKHLISVQQKLEHLNAEVATLLALTASETTVARITDTQAKQSVGTLTAHTKPASVGINRFRQLQINDQVGA